MFDCVRTLSVLHARRALIDKYQLAPDMTHKGETRDGLWPGNPLDLRSRACVSSHECGFIFIPQELPKKHNF
jgi:hypothetical protein